MSRKIPNPENSELGNLQMSHSETFGNGNVPIWHISVARKRRLNSDFMVRGHNRKSVINRLFHGRGYNRKTVIKRLKIGFSRARKPEKT